MAEKAPLWTIFVGLVSLFLFSFWAAYAYFSNPAEIPMEPIVMAIIALLGVIGAWFFQVNAANKRKNVNTRTIKARGNVTIGDDGPDAGGTDATDKNINDGAIHSGGDVRIGDHQTGGR